jgi:predicted kinase
MNENVKLNSLGKAVTKPSQVIIIMRGIPSAGKSTKAKSLVGDGIIHSTDAVIESMGDYRAFFTAMIESKDYSALHKAHDTNFKNAKKSMKSGISPIIIDNTNIKANEPKKFVVEALTMGYDDINIQIVDIGDGGLDAEALSARNTHGVPLEKIEAMIQSHKSVGELTLKKILEAKDMFKISPILYSAVVLDRASITKLLQVAGSYPADVPDGWIMGKDGKYFCDHMTICLGPLKDKSDLGKEVTITVTHAGVSDMAIAFKVEGYPTKNLIPHITLAINPEGGMPKMSNDITKWQDLKRFVVKGIVTEVSRYKKKEEATEVKS